MNTEKQYIQAFNNGYFLACYELKLINDIIKNLTPFNNYTSGLFSGKDQALLELKRETDLEELLQLRSKSTQKDIDRTM